MSTYKLRGSAGYIIGGIVILIFIAFTASFYTSPSTLYHHTTKSSQENLLENIQNATLGFEKIFVINLASRTDHRDAIALAASLTGLEVDFINGVTKVDRKTLPPGAEESAYKDAELGNWRAHLNVARTYVKGTR